MSRPDALIALLEDLLPEEREHSIAPTEQSKAVVYIDGDVEVVLDASECNRLFLRPSLVRQLYEALGSPDDAALELIDLTVPPDVLTEMERLFSAVDED